MGSLLNLKLLSPGHRPLSETTNINGRGDTATYKASPPPDRLARACAVETSRKASSLSVSWLLEQLAVWRTCLGRHTGQYLGTITAS
ncbi:L-galactonate dehydratase [Fusarium oxysporum f. sp. albedinis]|nr:L-galactonate dehydratase [Fusarium oxysporum f. sp. albedinis]